MLIRLHATPHAWRRAPHFLGDSSGTRGFLRRGTFVERRDLIALEQKLRLVPVRGCAVLATSEGAAASWVYHRIPVFCCCGAPQGAGLPTCCMLARLAIPLFGEAMLLQGGPLHAACCSRCTVRLVDISHMHQAVFLMLQ